MEAARRTREAQQAAKRPEQLPIWPQNTRGIPNALIRNAIFRVGSKNETERRTMINEEIASVNGLSVVFSGTELRVDDDRDVWLQVAHFARSTNLGEIFTCSSYALIKSLGWAPNGANYKRLEACIERLNTASIKVIRKVASPNGQVRTQQYYGGLLRKATLEKVNEDDARAVWNIWLEPEIIDLFGADQYTLIHWDTHLKLSPLGKWLYDFYKSHAEPYPYKVETLHRLCGSKSKRLADFRVTLRAQFERMKQEGAIADYAITTEDHVVVSHLQS